MDLEEEGLFVSYIDPELLKNLHNISISIASAVTAYARVYMSQFKNRDDIKLYYTDTDSVFIDSDLPTDLLSNDLGKFKLEYIFKKAVFVGAKVYGGITNKDEYICKIKGYKNPKLVSFDDLEKLLIKDSNMSLKHFKWFRSLDNCSTITINEQLYTLIATENKRELIYDESGKLKKRIELLSYRHEW